MANPKSCSPTKFLGQSWSNWADAAFSEESNDTESTAEAVDSGVDSSSNRGNGKAESMKLHRTDFALFGICPSQDQFYLVVCEQCGQVVKPQGLKRHIDARHNGKAPNRPPEKMKVCRSVPPQPVPLSKHPPQRESPRTHNLQQKSQRPPPQPPPVATRGSSVSPPPSLSPPPPPQAIESSPVAIPHVELKLSVPLPPQLNAEMITSPVSRPMKIAKTSRVNEQSCSILVGDKPPKVIKPETIVNNHNQPMVLIPKISPESVWTEASLLKELPPPPVIPSTTVPATTPVATTTAATTASTKRSKKKDSPRKFLPLKDREYDPNKHCGVTGDEGKPCIRSLTCKTHALSLRRKVLGRQKPLDELLAERKAFNASHYQQTHGAKHAKRESGFHPVTPQLASGMSNLHVTQSSTHKIERLHSVPKTTPKTHASPRPPRPPDLGVHPVKRSHSNSAPSTPTTSDPKSLARSDSSSGRVSGLSVDPQFDAEESVSDPYLCTYQQPKPIAVCHYGAHHIGRGVYLFDRRLHSLRSSLKALIDKQLNPPPPKKACASSSLSQSATCLSTSNVPSDVKDSTNVSSPMLNQVTTPAQKPATKTLAKSSHPKRSKTNAKSLRASSGSGTTQQKLTKSQKKNAMISNTSTSAAATNATQLITNTAIPIGGTLQLASGSSAPFLVTTNGLQNAEYIDPSVLGVDASTNLIDQAGNLKNLVVVTNIEPNVNGGQPSKVNQTRIPIFSTIAGNAPVLLQNITVGHDGKMNVKSRTKNNSKLKGGGKAKSGLAFQGGVLVNQSLLQQPQQMVKQDIVSQDIRGYQTVQTPISKANNPQVNQGSATTHMLSSLPNGIIPSPSNIKPFLATSSIGNQQHTAIVQSSSPCNTSPPGPIVTDTAPTQNFTAVLSQSGKVKLVATSKANSSLGKALTNQPSMQLAQQMTLSQAASRLQSQQLMANLITTTQQQSKPLHINNALLQNHAALPTVVQGKGTSALTLAFNQQPIFLQGQNLAAEHPQQ